MKKAAKYLLGFVSGVIIFLIVLPLVLTLLLQVNFIQQWAANTATEFLTKQVGSKVSIAKIELGLFKSAYFEDVYVEDRRGDTMIYINNLNVRVSGINFITGKIDLNTVTVDSAKIFLYKDTLGVINIKHFFDALKPEIPPHNPPNFRMTAMQVNLLNTHFKLYDETIEPQDNGVNFKDLDIDKINFQAQGVNIFNYDIKLAINFMRFSEKSGFVLNHFNSTDCGVNGTGLRFEGVTLETPNSRLNARHVNFLYNSWWAYSDFVNMVTLDIKILPSKLNFRTVNHFIKEKVPLNELPFEFAGSVVGPVPRMVGRIDKLDVAGNNISGDFVVTGLPDIEKTTFEFDLEALRTNQTHIDDLIYQLSGKHLQGDLPNMLKRCGDVMITGRFDGLVANFNANCVVNTQIGKIDAGLRLEPHTQKGVSFLGTVSTREFDLGKLLKSNSLGGFSVNAQVKGVARANAIRFESNADIEKLTWNGYDYSQIALEGEFNNRIFDGHLSSLADTNLIFTTSGLFDFSDSQLPKYNFEMDLKRADLYALKINKRDSVSVLSAEFKAGFEGTTIDNINGSLNIDSIYYINQFDTVHTSEINLFSVNSPTSKELRMSSNFADVKLQGRNSYSNIFGYFSQMASTYIPSFADATQVVIGRRSEAVKVVEKTYDDGYYTLDVDVKKANNVASIFVPGLEIAEGTTLNFFFNPAKHRFNFSLNSDYILKSGNNEEGGFLVEKLIVDSRNVTDSLSVFLTAQSVGLGSFEMPDFSIIGGVKNNRISFAARFTDKKNGNSALINTTTNIYRNSDGAPQIKVSLHPSNVRLNNSSWLMQDCDVIFDTAAISANNFELRNSPQSLSINGRIGKQSSDTLKIDINRFQVKPLSFLIEDVGYNIDGFATGSVNGVSLLGDPQLFADVDFNDVIFSGYSLPDSKLLSKYDSENQRILISLNTPNEEPVRGYYDIAKKFYSVNLNFPRLDLVLLEPLLQGVLRDTKGSADAKLVLSGTGETPTLNGTIRINEYRAKIDFTKVTYNLTGDVTVKNNRFELATTKIYDSEGHSGDLTGFFDSKYFKELNFGLNARFTDLLALNTTQNDNSMFYGKGYGTGVMDIEGTERFTSLSVTAQTALNSSIVMPFTNISTVTQANFITFVDPKKIVEDRVDVVRKGLFIKKLQSKLTNELDIKLDLQVLPNTTALVQYSNSIMDNIIKGQGHGRLRMHINPSQEIFTLEGPMEIEKGSYRLVLEIADKTFVLQPGGRLIWSGDPANPIVDFTGVYKVRASLDPLLGLTGAGASSANIDCGIKMNGNLWSPTISFSITAPSATPETQNLLRNSLNTEEAMSMQFFSLFISNSFMPDMANSSIGTVGGAFVATTGIEFISSQIGALFSSKNFNFRPTYRPRSETGSEEVGFKASINLIQDKVLIEAEGNYATTQTNSRQTSPFTGGGNVTVLLNKTGTLSLKGFTRVIDRFDETQGLQESGVGVYFRQDFQNWADLSRRYKAYIEKVKLEAEHRKQLREHRQKN